MKVLVFLIAAIALAWFGKKGKPVMEPEVTEEEVFTPEDDIFLEAMQFWPYWRDREGLLELKDRALAALDSGEKISTIAPEHEGHLDALQEVVEGVYRYQQLEEDKDANG